MSCSAEEASEEYRRLFEQGIELVFLKEPYINSKTYKDTFQKALNMSDEEQSEMLGNMLRDLLSRQVKLSYEQALKEMENAERKIHEEIKAIKKELAEPGLMLEEKKQAGRERGYTFGKEKKELVKSEIRRFNRTFEGVLSDKETTDLVNISRPTFYKYKKEMLEELEKEATAIENRIKSKSNCKVS